MITRIPFGDCYCIWAEPKLLLLFLLFVFCVFWEGGWDTEVGHMILGPPLRVLQELLCSIGDVSAPLSHSEICSVDPWFCSGYLGLSPAPLPLGGAAWDPSLPRAVDSGPSLPLREEFLSRSLSLSLFGAPVAGCHLVQFFRG